MHALSLLAQSLEVIAQVEQGGLNEPWSMEPSTRTIGSRGKANLPSGIASMAIELVVAQKLQNAESRGDRHQES